MKKWNSKHDFADAITTEDMMMTLGNPNKRNINMTQAKVMVDEILFLHEKGNSFVPKMAVHSMIRNKRKGAMFLFYRDQGERMIDIYDKMFKHYWFPLSRIRKNLKRCR